MINSLLDSVLDRTVVAGYTNVGYRIRSRGWSAYELRQMQGKVVLVTGASSGLGFAAAEGFARLGATVWALARSLDRGEQARAGIAQRSGNGDVHLALCDLSKLESVREFARRFGDQAARLDVLVNNAGVLTEERALSADGIELTLATNVVGPYLLTNLLIPLLQESAPARIINVSSGGMYTQRISVDDLQSEHGQFDGPTAYARTKRAQVILTELWAQRLAGTGVVVHAMHPGWADTPGVRSSLPASTRRHDHCSERPRRAPTRSSGSEPPPNRTTVPAGSGTTAGSAPRTCCHGRERRDRSASAYGRSASVSAAGRPPNPTRFHSDPHKEHLQWPTIEHRSTSSNPARTCSDTSATSRQPSNGIRASWKRSV